MGLLYLSHVLIIICSSSGFAAQTALGILRARYVSWLQQGWRSTLSLIGKTTIELRDQHVIITGDDAISSRSSTNTSEQDAVCLVSIFEYQDANAVA
jgi:hypothetical protein